MSILNFLNVSCAIPKVHLAQPMENANEIIKCLKKDKVSQIVVFPELAITGYTCGDLFFQTTLLDKALEALEKIVKYSDKDNKLIIVGLPFSYESRLYNVAAVIQKGKLLGLVPKIFLPDNQEYYEKRWFDSGAGIEGEVNFDNYKVPLTSSILFKDRNNPEIKVGIEICEDLWAPNPPSTQLANEGAIIIANPSASNETITKNEYREQLISQQSARLNVAYLYSSCGFGESTQDLVFSGDAIIAEKGIILAESERFLLENQIVKAQIDPEILIHDRRVQASYKDSKTNEKLAEVDIDLELTDVQTREFSKNPFVPNNTEDRDKRSKEILDIQSFGLGTRASKIGDDTNLVLGISGGLDSTLALIVAKQTCDKFGWSPDKIKAVTMPGFGTTDRTYQNAINLIKEIGADFREIPIRESVKQHLKDLNHPLDQKDTVYENSQARERMQILMDLANQVNGIVVGTGDLSELALGWATYNGDHMSMYGVNADVPKTLVRYLVRYYADNSEENLKKILYDILDTPVSPELLPPDEEGKIEQKTEEKIGPYELHDFFLFHHLRNGYSPRKIFAIAKETFKGDYTDEEILKWLKTFYSRFFSQQFKRSTLPDGPKVGSVSLSPRGDWRMPTDVSSQIWREELEVLEKQMNKKLELI